MVSQPTPDGQPPSQETRASAAEPWDIAEPRGITEPQLPASSATSTPGLARPRWQRALLLAAGWTVLGLALLGVFLPLLPTTPLVLLAAFFFARGSDRVHGWLLRHRIFGHVLREWQQHRSIPRRAKWTSIVLVVATFSVTWVVVPNCVYGYVTLLVVGAALLWFLARLPTRPRASGASVGPV